VLEDLSLSCPWDVRMGARLQKVMFCLVSCGNTGEMPES
jgi:hypothetical protein